MNDIPFNKPYLAGKELYYMAQAVLSGHISGDGPFTKRCQDWLEKKLAVPRVLLTNSCTAALEMAAMLCDLQPGDEVLMPSFTFVTTANAFFLRGARPVFCDIHPDTLNIDENDVAQKMTPRAKALVPVHYAGVGCHMDLLLAEAARHRLTVVEDAAQGIDALYQDRPLGTFGALGTLSFHETKNVSCGEGGALLINDATLIERAEIIREKGTNRSQFYRGQVDKYTWVDIGSSYLPSDLAAAYLLAQLEHMHEISARRRVIFQRYQDAFLPLQQAGHATLPFIPANCQSNSHIFYLLVQNETVRDNLIQFLRTRGILAVFHYVPLHLSPVGRTFSYRPGDLPITESVSGRLLRLPLYMELNATDQDRVIAAVIDFFNQAKQ